MCVRTIRLLLLACLSLPLAGCVVSPERLSKEQLNAAVADHHTQVTANQEPVGGSIDLYEAMARALKYNLDRRVETAEQALRLGELDLAHFSLLPNAVANSGFAARDNFSASSSFNLTSGTQNFAASTSQERKITSADIGFTWNVLDFGLSYVRARQSADKVLVQDELRRKVMHRIVEDVRSAYWRAVSAERLMTRLKSLEGQTRAALAETRNLYATRQTSPITALTYERELIEIKQKVGEIQRELNTAKAQLAALMNLPPDTSFALVVPPRGQAQPAPALEPGETISAALYNRPELRELQYRLRINEQEAHAALLELLPGLQLYAGSNFDSNDFLLNAQWLNWGAKAGWNLIKVFNYPARRDVVERQETLLKTRGLALTMAIMTQVHVSRIRFLHAKKELETAGEYRDVQTRLLAQMRAEAAADRISKQTLIREEMNTLISEAKYDIAYAALQNGYANLYSSMGLDPYSWEIDREQTVSGLREQLKALWIERGDHGAAWKKRVAWTE